MKRITKILTLLIIFVLLTGCLTSLPTNGKPFTPPIAFGPEWLDSMIELAAAFSLANTTSAPINPYALPIGIGLAGITAMLEALRRKEKSGRKFAEHKLNAPGKT